ncbi:hypothetical protein GJ496_011589 [Pomphorhynchus laevis]|nr:hypothetical protein GJ496_011638 [Pomphorhynchus laevis]KAI0980051.1 hypothetical protein GJ496_011589 [Pomphorhynchus laevis]
MSLEQILRFTLPNASVSSYQLLQRDQAIAVAAKSNISRFGSFIEGVGQYRKDDMFKKCLFSKLINAQIAACNYTGKIGSMLRKRRNMLFDQLFEELKNSKSITNRNHVRSKSVDVHNYSTDDDYCYRSPAYCTRSSRFWTKKLTKLHSV